MVVSAKKYWDQRFLEWNKWIKKGGQRSEFPLKNWKYPTDRLKDQKWKWGNHNHSVYLLPEPYWGNSVNPSVVFVNINPGAVKEKGSIHEDYKTLKKYSYYKLASKNVLNNKHADDWHRKRFNWASKLDTSIDPLNGLSVELIPWHSKGARDVTSYILENGQAVIENLLRFVDILPTENIFRNTFIVRSAVFMDLLNRDFFIKYFNKSTVKNLTLARKGNIIKPISFLTQIRLLEEHGYSKFLVFHGGASNMMPLNEYLILDEGVSLKDYLRAENG